MCLVVIGGLLFCTGSASWWNLKGFFGGSRRTVGGLGSAEEEEDVVVLGAAGSGKTTAFTSRLPYGWAEKEFLEEVEVLLVVKARDCDESSMETIFGLDCLGMSLGEREEVLSFLRSNKKREKIVVIVDGE